jgi:tetratricopeptide (TPR) repeat protein
MADGAIRVLDSHPDTIDEDGMVSRITAGLLLASVSWCALAADKSPDQQIKSLETRIVELNGRGQYADAVPLAKQVVDLRQKRTGTEDPDYASAISNLAMLYKSLGRFDDAEPLLEQSLAIRRKVLKPSDPLTVATIGSLAEIYGDEGKPEQAEPLLKQVDGIASPEIAGGAEAAGMTYLRQNHFDQAIPLLKQAMDAYRKVYPAGNSKLAAATANLAQAYIAAGRPDQAEPLLKQASDTAGGDGQAEVDSLTRQSDFYVSQNRPDDAAPILTRVVALRQKMGTEDKNLAARVGNLAVLFANAGRYAESVPFWQDNIAIYEKIGGPDNVAVAGSLDNLATVYLNQGDIDTAEPLIQRSASIYAKAGGETSPQYVATQDRLAKIAQRRKMLEQQKQQQDQPPPQPQPPAQKQPAIPR